MSASQNWWNIDTPTFDSDQKIAVHQQSEQFTISHDLYRAIEELRSVPVLRWPDEVTFDDNIISDKVDQINWNGVTTTNASASATVVKTEFLSRTTATKTTEISALSSEWHCTVQTNDQRKVRPAGSVENGDDSVRSSSRSHQFHITAIPSVSLTSQTSWTSVNDKRVAFNADSGKGDSFSSVEQQTAPANGSDLRISDSVFSDVPTPIDAELLIDDVYERKMDELDQLELDEIVADDPEDLRSLPLDSTVTEFSDLRVYNSDDQDTSDIPTSQLLIESSTERRLLPMTRITERSFRLDGSPIEVCCAGQVDPRSVSVSTASSLTDRSTASSCVDNLSAEEMFEEIVESLKDTVSENDTELDVWIGEENQLSFDDSTVKSGPGQLETAVSYPDPVTVNKKFVLPLQPLTWPSSHSSRINDKLSASEEKRQKNLTDCLASTLNDCLDALSQNDESSCQTDVPQRVTNVRHQMYYTTNRDIIGSPSSAKSSRTYSSLDDCRQYVMSPSSGVQSDIVDVDIDEEFDANAAFDVAGAMGDMAAAESTSLDSLMEMADGNDSYSDQTVIRRTTSSSSRRSGDHITVNGFRETPTAPLTTSVKTGTNIVAADRTETTETAERCEVDESNKGESQVVEYDDKLPKVKVLFEELITQEIVLNIVLPRRPKKKEKKRGAEMGGCVDGSEFVESRIVDRRNGRKPPQRDLHIHRVVRLSDTGDHRPVSEHVTSNGQKRITESASVENDYTMPAVSSSVTDGCVVPSRADELRRPLSVELQRQAESATTEQLDDNSRLQITRRDRFKVMRGPEGTGAVIFNAPVTSIKDVVDEVGRSLIGDQNQSLLPAGTRVTCNAVERKSTATLPAGDVTVVHRTIVDGDKCKRPMLRTAANQI